MAPDVSTCSSVHLKVTHPPPFLSSISAKVGWQSDLNSSFYQDFIGWSWAKLLISVYLLYKKFDVYCPALADFEAHSNSRGVESGFFFWCMRNLTQDQILVQLWSIVSLGKFICPTQVQFCLTHTGENVSRFSEKLPTQGQE